MKKVCSWTCTCSDSGDGFPFLAIFSNKKFPVHRFTNNLSNIPVKHSLHPCNILWQKMTGTDLALFVAIASLTLAIVLAVPVPDPGRPGLLDKDVFLDPIASRQDDGKLQNG